MLAIRMQRTGRKGHAMFRVIVQDSRLTPTSGKVVAQLGSYDPHAKTITLDKEKATFYLGHGAQPSGRVTRLLKSEGVKLPDWVKLPATDKKRVVRNADKRRSTRPPEEAKPVEEAKEEISEASVAPEAPEAEEAAVAEVPAEETEAPAAETPPAEPAEDKPAEAAKDA
jgi:small subunit ribosomal protein S16